MRGRDREHVGKLVEAAVGGFIARQLRGHVEALRIEAEQITDRVAVLGAVQSMHGTDAPGIGTRGPRGIERALDLAGGGMIRRGVRARPSWRRHRSGAQFLDNRFPYLRMAARIHRVETIERETAGARAL